MVYQENLICTGCLVKLPKTNYHYLDENPLMDRFYGKLPLMDVFSYLKFIKGGITQHLLHQFKYEKMPELGVLLGGWFACDLLKANKLNMVDLILPVPLHEDKLKERGYNQSHVLGLAMARAAKIPYSDKAVIRQAVTGPQALKKDKLERWENVCNSFKVTDESLICGKHILLVDDVLTTGSTLEACALPLLAGGISSLSLATLAVAI